MRDGEVFWEYCFRLGNGDRGGRRRWWSGLRRNGHRRVGVLSEVSPNGAEYFAYFRQECRRQGVAIAAVETVSQATTTLAENRTTCGRSIPMHWPTWATASGRRTASRQGLEQTGWDPPRIMSTAFMFYLMGFESPKAGSGSISGARTIL